jgi:outer membrane protein TolC
VISKDLYKAGYANYLEVVTAQQNVLDAELRLIETRKRLHLANINLYRALGGGWTRDGQ